MARLGKLKVFLGMCPGVGKTFAMLQAAQELKRQGTDIVIGVVETHGRADTAALLDQLELLPRKTIVHRETEISEFDIDALIARRPQLALIDELAHSNAPGSRHPKRWQDVAEILDAGIDVYTTLNIQHLESRADVVAAITKTTVRETVPDRFLDRAHEIELIDLTPRDLQRRLEEGKVYTADRAQTAAQNFFKESHLTALRQLALRYTAERVGVDLREFQSQRRQEQPWRTSERLMVAVGPSPFSRSLIRRTRAMAGALDAPWFAIAISTDEPLTKDDQARLTQNLTVARQLGAETATIEATSLVDGLLHAARERSVTQIIMGKSPRHRVRDFFFPPPALRLLQQSGAIDVVAIEPRLDPTTPEHEVSNKKSSFSFSFQLPALGKALLIALLLAICCWPLQSILSPQDIAMMMLCGVIVGALFLNATGTLALAIFTGLFWNALFTEPRFSLSIHSTSDVTMFIALLVASLSMGWLSNRLQRRSQVIARQQEHTAKLLQINSILTTGSDTDESMRQCMHTISTLFHMPHALQLRDNETHLLQAAHAASNLILDAKEQGVAQWAFDKQQPAGRGTDTLPESQALHLPLQGKTCAMGVLSVQWNPAHHTLAEREILSSIAAQIGLALERNHLLHAIHHAEFLERSEQLRRTLLDHVSHELRTPVAVIGSAIEALETHELSTEIKGEMRHAQKRLCAVVNQLIESSRIESGGIQPKPEWCDVGETLEIAREQAADALERHEVKIHLPTTPSPLVWIDADLLISALAHLLTNAGHHTPEGTLIEVHSRLIHEQEWQITVRDHGPGLDDPERAFDRFYRGEKSRPGGIGLGLSIVRGLVRGLAGKCLARNAIDGGAEFIITVPIRITHLTPENL